MKLFPYKIFLLAAIGLLSVAVLIRPHVERQNRHRPWFPYACSPLDVDGLAKLTGRPSWSVDTVQVAKAIRLNGLIRRPESHQAPWLLYFPGNDPHQLLVGQTFLDRVRADRDWGLAVYAYRGYDSSGGAPSPEVLATDGDQILRHLLERESLRPAQVHAVAHSLGGYVSTHVVAHAATSHRRLASLTLLAGIYEAELVHSSILARISLGDVYRTLPSLADIPAPVLVLHGTADAAVGIDQSRNSVAHLGNRARLLEIPGAGHALNETDAAIVATREMVELSSKVLPH